MGETVSANRLNVKEKQVYKSCMKLWNNTLVKVGLRSNSIELIIASKLPHNSYEGNCYRNSIFYDQKANKAYVRRKRLENIGELAIILAHTAAHIRTYDVSGGTMMNDDSPAFRKHFNAALLSNLTNQAKDTS